MNEHLSSTVLKAALVGAFGGALLGFDTAVISGATEGLRHSFLLSPASLGVTVSAAVWGTVAGAIAAGPVGQRLGGRRSLLILGACYLVSAFGAALAGNWTSFLLFRFIGGLGMGGSSVIVPVYIAELSPARTRGRLVGAFQIAILVGIVLAYLSNLLIGFVAPAAAEWRWELGVAAAPAALFMLLMAGAPPSPRWLASKGRLKEAQAVLLHLGSPDPMAELASFSRGLAPQAEGSARLFSRRYRKPILLAMLLAAFNQLVGINAVLYYLNDIFRMAGFDRASQHIQAVTIGVVMLIADIAALSVIDRIGRRALLMIGSVGMALSLGAIAVILNLPALHGWMLPFLIFYVAAFAFSQGAVIWVYLSEIFPTAVRARGQSLGSTTHWLMNALISFAFPIVAAGAASWPFILFGAMAVVQLVLVYLLFPETRGVSLEELQARLVTPAAAPERAVSC